MSNNAEMDSQVFTTPSNTLLERDDVEVVEAQDDATSFFSRWGWLFGLVPGLALAAVILLTAPILRGWTSEILPEPTFAFAGSTADLDELRKETEQLESRVASLQQKGETLIPDKPYLIVDTSDNRVFLMSEDKVLHEGVCSSGSYIQLKAADGREWVFATPRGMFRIHGKMKSPIWRKPDWAFIEDGLPVPGANAPERFEAGVLGEYALPFGNGYLIHGTLYKRLLGQPVTHGCVRLGDEDLRVVYQNLEIGSNVLVY